MPFAHICSRGGHAPVSIHYELCGETEDPNKRIILLTGFATSKELWYTQLAFFVERGFEVCTLDNRGSGESTAPLERYTTSMFAHDALDVLSYIQWNHPMHVVGLSMGGMIAQELACLLIPHKRLLSLTLAATYLGYGPRSIPPVRSWFKMMLLAHPNLERHVSAILNIHYSQSFLNRPTRSPNEPESLLHYKKEKRITVRDVFQSQYLERLSRLPKLRILPVVSQLSAVLTHNLNPGNRKLLLQSNVPILVITSQNDEVVRSVNSFFIKDIFSENCSLVVLDGGGHVINIEHAEDFNLCVYEHILRALALHISST